MGAVAPKNNPALVFLHLLPDLYRSSSVIFKID